MRIYINKPFTSYHPFSLTFMIIQLEETTTSLDLPLSLAVIIGIAVGGVVFFLLLLLSLFCCWYLCCHGSGYEYRTGTEDLQYRITAHYKTEGATHFRTRQDSLASSFRSRMSSLSRSRMSSVRSSLGMKPKVLREKRENETYENEGTQPQMFSTPL